MFLPSIDVDSVLYAPGSLRPAKDYYHQNLHLRPSEPFRTDVVSSVHDKLGG